MSAFQSRTIDLQGLLDQKQPESRPSTRPTTTTFRTISRQTKAHWSNRFRRDVNDLEYDVKYNLIKGKSDLNQQTKYHKNLKGKLRSSQAKRSQSRESGISLEKYKKGMDMFKASRQGNPERFDLIEQKKYSTIDTQGLCKHQFQQTIGGKLIHKSNHHMGFQYQTERSINLNPVWYESSKEIDLIKIMKKNKMNKSHGFSSYTQRKVFQPKEQLDKFYDTAHSFRLASAKSVKQTYKFDGVTKRKDPKPPLGVKLVYNEHKSKQKILTRTIALPMSSLKRELHFSRQVISPERGCYR